MMRNNIKRTAAAEIITATIVIVESPEAASANCVGVAVGEEVGVFAGICEKAVGEGVAAIDGEGLGAGESPGGRLGAGVAA